MLSFCDQIQQNREFQVLYLLLACTCSLSSSGYMHKAFFNFLQTGAILLRCPGTHLFSLLGKHYLSQTAPLKIVSRARCTAFFCHLSITAHCTRPSFICHPPLTQLPNSLIQFRELKKILTLFGSGRPTWSWS